MLSKEAALYYEQVEEIDVKPELGTEERSRLLSYQVDRFIFLVSLGFLSVFFCD